MAAKKQITIQVIHGPNLNMLGTREQDIYGDVTLDSIDKALKKKAKELKVTLESFQSNTEGELVNKIQSCTKKISGILINPAAYTHTSVAIRDALLAAHVPVVEVHLSNIYKREPFRHHSYVSSVAVGQICGFGPHSYLLGLEALVESLKK